MPTTAKQFPLIAAIDLGSNSFHMVLAKADHGEIRILERLGEKVQLAAGLDEERQLSEEAMQRGLDCLRRFGQLIQGLPQRDYLQGYAGQLRYLPLVTREQVPGTLHGRVTTLLANGELERAAGFALEPEQGRVMLCGNPQMIDDCRALLKALAIPGYLPVGAAVVGAN